MAIRIRKITPAQGNTPVFIKCLVHLSPRPMAQIKVIGAIKMISLFSWVLQTIVLKSVEDDLLMVLNGPLNKLQSTLNDPLVKYIKGKFQL